MKAILILMLLVVVLTGCEDETTYHHNAMRVEIHYMDSTDGHVCIDGAGCWDIRSNTLQSREPNNTINPWYGSKLRFKLKGFNELAFEPVVVRRFNWVYKDHMETSDN